MKKINLRDTGRSSRSEAELKELEERGADKVMKLLEDVEQ